MSKIIYEAIGVFLEAYSPNQTLHVEALQCGKNLVRQPIFGYFHHTVALIYILNHCLYMLSIV